MVAELGRTRLDTRREKARRTAVGALAGLGVVLAAWLAAPVAAWLTGSGWTWPALGVQPLTTGGSGGLLGLPHVGAEQPAAAARPQVPVTLSWPAPAWTTALVAAPLWAGWLYTVVRPVLRGLHRETRHRGLASPRRIRRGLSAAAARKAGRFTLPTHSWLARMLLTTSAFGYHLGRAVRPHGGGEVWVDWEQRMRLIARTGWGKTSRVLVPLIRELPGPALISSTEPAIFEQTVLARTHRRTRLRWGWLDLVARRWLPLREYPVAVVDFSNPAARYAAGWPRVHWNPIDGCTDYDIASRRAKALLAGTDTGDGDRGSSNDWIFRESATEVLTAWLHAAALADAEISDLQEWLRDTSENRPIAILEDHPRADPSAVDALRKHLDRRSEKTTASVERFLTLALRSLTSADGRELCGQRFAADGTRQPTFDLPGFLASGGTIYVLCDAARIDRARPVLSLFANEVFFAAADAALAQPKHRLPQPFMGILDEMRWGVTVSELPYVANALRKYGIGYVYSVQSAADEEVVYGGQTASLRAGAGVSMFGGIDIDSARELSDRAGTTPVVTATRGEHDSEHVQHQQALTIADQQDLADGESVVSARGMRPFIAHTPLLYDQPRLARRIEKESAQVAATVHAARARTAAAESSREAAADAGADFTTEQE